MGNTGASKSVCLHCHVELVNERPWPGLGILADCPSCNSSFLRRCITAQERERRLIETQERAFRGRRVGSAERWAGAWKAVGRAYRREGNKVDAERCLNNGLVLLGWREGGLRGAEVRA